MKAVLGDTAIAEAPTEDLIRIEGNWYFPPSSVTAGLLSPSPRRTRPHSSGSAKTSATMSRSGKKFRSSTSGLLARPRCGSSLRRSLRPEGSHLCPVAAASHRAPASVVGARLIEEDERAVCGRALADSMLGVVTEKVDGVARDRGECLAGANAAATGLTISTLE